MAIFYYIDFIVFNSIYSSHLRNRLKKKVSTLYTIYPGWILSILVAA